jgi:hypothetical protein
MLMCVVLVVAFICHWVSYFSWIDSIGKVPKTFHLKFSKTLQCLINQIITFPPWNHLIPLPFTGQCLQERCFLPEDSSYDSFVDHHGSQLSPKGYPIYPTTDIIFVYEPNVSVLGDFGLISFTQTRAEYLWWLGDCQMDPLLRNYALQWKKKDFLWLGSSPTDEGEKDVVACTGSHVMRVKGGRELSFWLLRMDDTATVLSPGFRRVQTSSPWSPFPWPWGKIFQGQTCTLENWTWQESLLPVSASPGPHLGRQLGWGLC